MGASNTTSFSKPQHPPAYFGGCSLIVDMLWRSCWWNTKRRALKVCSFQVITPNTAPDCFLYVFLHYQKQAFSLFHIHSEHAD